MTTTAGLPAVRVSLHLALLVEPVGSAAVVELADAAVEHYALGYSKHPPATLFDEAHQVRRLLSQALASGKTPTAVATDMHRSIGWLSALLGNLAHHLSDDAGARAHLATALVFGERCGDNRLVAWTCGAQSMIARAAGEPAFALEHAQRGLAHATAGLPRAQLHGWAQLSSLSALGRAHDADRAFADASDALEADQRGFAPGRFGYDEAEHRLHHAEAQRTLGRTDSAIATAQTSLDLCLTGTPGWAAAALTLAQAEAASHPDDAAQRALDVLDKIPAARLRSTSRSRLSQLTTALAAADTVSVADLHERVRALAPAIDAHGSAAI